MATYYMRADGSAANKAAATGPTSSASACMNISVHNGETFSAGDTIVISDAGGNYVAELLVPSSGASGNPITYTVDGTPTIDGQDTRTECFQISSKDHITVTGPLSLIDATSSCWLVEGTSTGIVCTNVTASGSGNQAFQNLDTASCTYNDITGTGCTDDGFSMHDSSVAVINTGTFTSNAQGINMVGDSELTADDLTVTGNTSSAVSLESTATQVTATITNSTLEDGLTVVVEAKDKATINLTDCDIAGTVTNANEALVHATLTGTINLTDCNVNGTAERGLYAEQTAEITMVGGTVANTSASYDYGVFTEDSSVVSITNATLTGVAGGETVYASQTSTVTLTDCTLDGSADAFVQCATADLTCDGCTFSATSVGRHAYLTGTGTLTLTGCMFDNNWTSCAVQATAAGTMDITYCLFVDAIGGNNYTVRPLTGTTTFNNNVMYCATASSRAVYVRGTFEAKNNIILGYNIAFYTVASFTLDCTNNCLHDVTTPFSGAGHGAGNVDGFTTDPLFSNEGGATAADYKITSGSPCIGTGTDVSLSEDYFGNTVGSTPDVGFHNFSTEGGPGTPSGIPGNLGINVAVRLGA